MEKRLALVLKREMKERPFVSLSDLLREVIDNGLRTLEPAGTNAPKQETKPRARVTKIGPGTFLFDPKGS